MRTNIIVKVSTKKDWEKVAQKVFDNDGEWSGGERRSFSEGWDRYKENSCIGVGVNTFGKMMTYGSECSYREDYPDYPVIPAKGFLEKQGRIIITRNS